MVQILRNRFFLVVSILNRQTNVYQVIWYILGAVWKSKVVSCVRMILKYLSVASVPFQPLKDKVSIFNTENTNSSVHDEACGHPRVCVENTQIYSLLGKLQCCYILFILKFVTLFHWFHNNRVITRGNRVLNSYP